VKLGSHVSSLQKARKAPYEDGLENAARLGFAGVELIAMDNAELAEYYTPERCRKLRETAERHGLTISQFAVFSTACEGMASLDPREKKAGLDVFIRGIDVCRDLGCDTVNLVAHWPVGLTCPHPYPPSYIHPIGRGMVQTSCAKMTMNLPEPFDFVAIWDNYVDSLRLVTEAAVERGIRFALEGHAHVIVSGTDAMLRLFDELDNEACVVNFDTSWHFIQREYLPMSIAKLGARIAHVHLRDADGLIYYGAPVGQGIIDWHGVVRTLKGVGYDGFLSLEYSGFDDFLDVARRSKRYMEQILEEAA
jgi:sugar phosphate isomerase/epimerase